MKLKKFRNAIFAVAYFKSGNDIEYLLLKRKKHWIGWEFPKGGIDLFETKKMAVKREVKEETGLKILNIKKFHISGRYRYKKEYKDRKGIFGQKFSLYAVEVQKSDVKIDKREHSGFKWENFEGAMEKLTWDSQKRCLKIVNKWVLLKKEPNMVENRRK
ncbi:MAG: NUDIX domain-containing protein [Nanoarchaeota archaeon]